MIEGNTIEDNGGSTIVGATNTASGIELENAGKHHDRRHRAGAGNVIDSNGGPGVAVVGAIATGNLIEGDSIYGNLGLGIDLGDTGSPVQNGSQGVGPNNYENYPVLTSASSTDDGVTISGTFISTPDDTFHFEFFSNDAPGHADTNNSADTNLYGDGQNLLGMPRSTTDENGNPISSPDGSAVINADGSFTVTLSTPVLAGQDYLTATATDVTIDSTEYGDTSEFSANFTIPAGSQAPVTSQNLQTLLAAGAPAGGTTTVFLPATTNAQAQAILSAANGLNPATTPTSNLVVDLGGQTIQDSNLDVPAQVTVTFTDGTFIGGSPALIVQSGTVSVSDSTFTNSTDAPTILVTGGSLELRNDDVEGSPTFADPVISVTGGSVDLGTTADPGGNILNVNGTGTWIQNTTSNPIPDVGDTFEINGVAQSVVVTGLSVTEGPLAGGETVTITGVNLADATAVDFGIIPATIVSDTPTQIVVASPAASAAGTVDVTVATPDGTSATTPADQFTVDPSGTFTVTNTLDDGSVGSMRWAIDQANAEPADTVSYINFNIGKRRSDDHAQYRPARNRQPHGHRRLYAAGRLRRHQHAIGGRQRHLADRTERHQH